MLTLKELIAKVSDLEIFKARAEDAQVKELRQQLSELSNTVNARVGELETQLAEANANLTTAKQTIQTISTEATAINDAINGACASLKLETKTDATSVEKIEAISGAVSATLAKLAVNPENLPANSPATPTKAKADLSNLSGLDKAIAANRAKHNSTAKK